MIEIIVTSSDHPDQTWHSTFHNDDIDKYDVWKCAFGMLQDIMYEYHTKKSPVTGLLEALERKKKVE